MLRRLAVALALCLGAFGGPLHALGLGAIRVESSLNQTFSATIPFTSLSPQEAENLRVRIADNRDFVRAGIDRSSYLSSVKLETITDDGNPRILLRGSQIAREPLLTILIDVRAGGPRVLREYTVFLDPPGSAPVPQSAPDPVPVEVPSAPVAAAPKVPATPVEPTAEERAEIARARSAGQYGPVRDGQALWKIAERLRPEDRRFTRAQMMLALYDLNPLAFENGDIGRVVVGQMLKIPADEQVAATGPVAASKLVARLAEQGGPLPDRTPPVVAPGAAAVIEPPVVAEPPVAAPEGEDSIDADSDPATGDGAVDPDPVETEAPPAEPPVAAKPKGPRKAALAPEAAGDDLFQTLLPWVAGALGLLLVLFALFRVFRQRRAQAEYAAASRATVAGAVAAGASTAAPRPRSVLEELEEVNRRLAEEDGATPAAAVKTDAKPAMAPKTDFDSTGAFSPNTFEIDLSDNDPISEADFHLAYGLYDEAALLLKTAAEKDPERVELSVKLAETYFAAGKADAFLGAAEGLQSRLDATAWEKIAIMGRQLCPDAELFRGDSGGGELSVDLSLDEAPAPSGPPVTRIDEGLDFQLEELELPAVVPAKPSASAGPSLADFDLGSFELSVDAKPAADPARKPDSLDFTDFDLGELKLEGDHARDLDLKLEDVTGLSMDEDFGEGEISTGDDVGTKLDLARAYVEMGDLEMARSLLDEVDVQGTDEQKHEASQLRERMLG